MTDSNSILNSTKIALGVGSESSSFDTEIIMHINSTFFTLSQMGLGPVDGFSIQDASAVWEDFLGASLKYAAAKSYMYLSVKLLFDPPTIGFVIAAFEKQKDEMLWRLSAAREEIVHPEPTDYVTLYTFMGEPVHIDSGDLDDRA